MTKEPEGVNDAAMKFWKEQGPLDLEKHIFKQGHLRFNKELEIKKIDIESGVYEG